MWQRGGRRPAQQQKLIKKSVYRSQFATSSVTENSWTLVLLFAELQDNSICWVLFVVDWLFCGKSWKYLGQLHSIKRMAQNKTKKERSMPTESKAIDSSCCRLWHWVGKLVGSMWQFLNAFSPSFWVHDGTFWCTQQTRVFHDRSRRFPPFPTKRQCRAFGSRWSRAFVPISPVLEIW